MIETEVIYQMSVQIGELLIAKSDYGKYAVISIMLTVGIGIVLPAMIAGYNKNNWSYIGFVILVIPIVIGVNAHNDIDKMIIEYEQLVIEQNELYESQIKSSTCEELRLHIIDVIENDYSYNVPGHPNYDSVNYIEDKNKWVQDLYYHKCEIPLRDEVMKLQ